MIELRLGIPTHNIIEQFRSGRLLCSSQFVDCLELTNNMISPRQRQDSALTVVINVPGTVISHISLNDMNITPLLEIPELVVLHT